MKDILLWDPRFPDRQPDRLSFADALASAAVRAGVAAPANPADFAVLNTGGALDPGTLTEIVVEDGFAKRMRRVVVPVSVAAIAVAQGVGAAVSASVIPTPTPTPVAPIITFASVVQDSMIANWDANHSTITQANGRVTSVSDLKNGYTMGDEGQGLGPQLMTYANGWKALRFNNDSFLSAPTVPALSTINNTVIMVLRQHTTFRGSQSFLSAGTRSVTGAQSPFQTVLAYTTALSTSQGAFVGRVTNEAESAARRYLQLGAQLQVAGWRNGPTGTPVASGTSVIGQRCGVNRKAITTSNINVAAVAGMELGRNAGGTQGPNINGTWACADIIACWVFDRPLTNDEFDAAMALVADSYDIPEVVDQVVYGIDSRTAGGGAGNHLSDCPAVVLTEPGAPYSFPKTVRAINAAVWGARWTVGGNSLEGQLNSPAAKDNLFYQLLPGRNVACMMGGINDNASISSGDGAAQVYARQVSQIPRLLEIGWEVKFFTEPHSGNINYAEGNVAAGQSSKWALDMSDQLFVDCNAGPGQTYEGKMRRGALHQIMLDGVPIFGTYAGTTSQYYNPGGDRIHQSTIGMFYMATGGDTPQNGWGSAFS